MEQKVTAENFESWNEEMAMRFDVDLFHNHPSSLVRFVERKRVNTIVKLVHAKSQDKILEVGCGAGNVLQKINQGKLFGIDLSNALLERAKKRLGSQADIRKANAEELPFGDNTFDKIYCTEVLEHVLDPTQAMLEMVRVGKNNGWVIISIPFEWTINLSKKLLIRLGLFNLLLKSKKGGTYPMNEHMEDEWHLREFSLKLLRQLAPSDLKEWKVARIPFFLYPLHYVVLFKIKKVAE